MEAIFKLSDGINTPSLIKVIGDKDIQVLKDYLNEVCRVANKNREIKFTYEVLCVN